MSSGLIATSEKQTLHGRYNLLADKYQIPVSKLYPNPVKEMQNWDGHVAKTQRPKMQRERDIEFGKSLAMIMTQISLGTSFDVLVFHPSTRQSQMA